jgi:hypothetical protein
MLHPASYIYNEWNWLLSGWLPWPSSWSFQPPDLSSAACTFWILGCGARRLKCDSYSTTKGVYLASGFLHIWYIELIAELVVALTNFALSTAWFWVLLLAHPLEYWAVQQVSWDAIPPQQKGARVFICCMQLLTYMVDGMDCPVCGCLDLVCACHSLILSSAACTSWIFLGCCGASQLRYDPSTTKGVRVILSSMQPLTYMGDGMGCPAWGCLYLVCTFHSLLIGVLLVAHFEEHWAVQQGSWDVSPPPPREILN